MSFVLAAKPRFVYLTNKQLQTIGKRLLTQSAKSSFKSSQCLLSGPNTMIKTASPKKPTTVWEVSCFSVWSYNRGILHRIQSI